MEQLIVGLIQAALQPYLQQFFNILIEIRDRLPAPGTVQAPIVVTPPIEQSGPTIPAFVYEVPKGAIPVTPVQPEPKELTRQEIGELASKVATTLGVTKASEIIMPFQVRPATEGERYPNMNNIVHTPANYAVLEAAFNAALAAAK